MNSYYKRIRRNQQHYRYNKYSQFNHTLFRIPQTQICKVVCSGVSYPAMTFKYGDGKFEKEAKEIVFDQIMLNIGCLGLVTQYSKILLSKVVVTCFDFDAVLLNSEKHKVTESAYYFETILKQLNYMKVKIRNVPPYVDGNYPSLMASDLSDNVREKNLKGLYHRYVWYCKCKNAVNFTSEYLNSALTLASLVSKHQIPVPVSKIMIVPMLRVYSNEKSEDSVEYYVSCKTKVDVYFTLSGRRMDPLKLTPKYKCVLFILYFIYSC